MLISIDGKNVFVKMRHQDPARPMLVLLHPIASSIDLEDQLAFPDWESCRYPNLLRYDLPGHGRSSNASEASEMTWSSLAKILLELLQRLHIRSVILAGSSMGAGVSLHAATTIGTSELVLRGIAAVVPPCSGIERKRFSADYNNWAKVLRQSGCSALIDHWRGLPATAFFAREFPKARDLSFAYVLNRDALSLAASFEGAALSDLPHADDLAKINCPVLLLGREDDKTHPISTIDLLKSLMPQAEVEIARSKRELLQWPQRLDAFSLSLDAAC